MGFHASPTVEVLWLFLLLTSLMVEVSDAYCERRLGMWRLPLMFLRMMYVSYCRWLFLVGSNNCGHDWWWICQAQWTMANIIDEWRWRGWLDLSAVNIITPASSVCFFFLKKDAVLMFSWCYQLVHIFHRIGPCDGLRALYYTSRKARFFGRTIYEGYRWRLTWTWAWWNRKWTWWWYWEFLAVPAEHCFRFSEVLSWRLSPFDPVRVWGHLPETDLEIGSSFLPTPSFIFTLQHLLPANRIHQQNPSLSLRIAFFVTPQGHRCEYHSITLTTALNSV